MPKHDFSSELILYPYDNGVKLIRPNANTKKTNTLLEISNSTFNVFFTDADMIVQYINAEQAHSFGYTQNEMLRSRLSKLMDKVSALELQDNNESVMREEHYKIFDEECILENDTIIQTVSIKLPWYNIDNKICGIVGFAAALNKHFFSSFLPKIAALGFLNKEHFQLAELQNQNVALTSREKIILKLILKGYSSKQIGRITSISHRTVEVHFQHIKNKLNVHSKAELIDVFN